MKGLILAGGVDGVFGSTDGVTYDSRSPKEFSETVALPSTWLFVSGEHDITVATDGEDTE